MHIRRTLSNNTKTGFYISHHVRIFTKSKVEKRNFTELRKNCIDVTGRDGLKEGLSNVSIRKTDTNCMDEAKREPNDRKYRFIPKTAIKGNTGLREPIKKENRRIYVYSEEYYKKNGKRNYVSGNANFKKNATDISYAKDKTEFTETGGHEVKHNKNKKFTNFPVLQNNQKNYTANENGSNMFITKLHDYLNITYRSESDKIKMDKMLKKLKSENLTCVAILNILKNLCNMFLKRTSINTEAPITLNYMENKNAIKKIKSYLEEYFIYIETFLQNYSTFLNEANLLEFLKYFYYLNYPIQQETMELLLERFYLCIDKMDDLKAVQVYYILQSFYKHFYFKKPDYYLSLVLNEKLKMSYVDKSHIFPSNFKMQNLLLNSYSNSNSEWDTRNGSIKTLFFVENVTKPKEKNTNKEIHQLPEEIKELLQIFKYIHNFHDSINFFYEYNIMASIEKYVPFFSVPELLIVFDIYKNGKNDALTTQLVERLFHEVEQMNENHLVLLAKHLCQYKNWNNKYTGEITGNETECSTNDLMKLQMVDKIVGIVRKDKEFFIPDNTALILLYLHELVQNIESQNEFLKREGNYVNNVSTQENPKMINDTRQANNGKDIHLKMKREIITFCDEHINNVHSFDTILNLYLLYIKNESIKNKTINIFEQKLKMNKNKLNKGNVSSIILTLSMYPFHTTKMLPYLENLINERLEETREMDESKLHIEDIIENTKINETVLKETNINEQLANCQTNHLIDISMSLGVIGRKHLKLWNYINVDKLILTTNKQLLLYLSYSFLLTNYWNPISWYFIIKRIVEGSKVYKRKHYELLYEILKCSILFNVVNLTNFTNNSFDRLNATSTIPTATNNVYIKNAKQKGTNESNKLFLKNLNYLLTTSYNHYKLKLIKMQYVSKVPYEEVFKYLKLKYQKNIEFKKLYIIPFLLKDYKIIIDPLPSTPIHKSSGFIMGEIQLKHQVFRFDKYTVLSFCDTLWDKYISMDKQGNSTYDIKALSEHFLTYIESQIKKENSKKNLHNPANLTDPLGLNTTKKDEKQTNQVSYLKVKKPNVVTPPNKKYLIYKGGLHNKNNYLKVKNKNAKR